MLRSQRKTTSLLISPEGWLINLFEIEDAMLFPLRAEGLLGPADFDELTATVKSLQDDIHAELTRLGEAPEPE